jgi:RsiW-degrading membrane proteinase PrsW (M82 family)
MTSKKLIGQLLAWLITPFGLHLALRLTQTQFSLLLKRVGGTVVVLVVKRVGTKV